MIWTDLKIQEQIWKPWFLPGLGKIDVYGKENENFKIDDDDTDNFFFFYIRGLSWTFGSIEIKRKENK